MPQKPNKAPEPTTRAVTSRAPSSTSRASPGRGSSLTLGKDTPMDTKALWSASIVDLLSLFSEWERRRLTGGRWSRRFREIHSVCMFTLCIENRTDQRYLIGFPHLGILAGSFTVSDVFDDRFGEIEDCDVVLIDDP